MQTKQKYWTDELSFISGVVLDYCSTKRALFDKRFEIADYLSKCMAGGFCNNENEARLCIDRWVAGKRKVTPPGTARKKREAKERAELLARVPIELTQAVQEVLTANVKAVEQYKAGVDKAINALVGQVIKKYKADAYVVRQLLITGVNAS